MKIKVKMYVYGWWNFKKKKGGVRNIEFIYIFDFLNWWCYFVDE